MFKKGDDRADQYLSYYSLEINSEVAKESCILAYKLCTFQFFSNLSKTKPYIKNKIQRISATSGKRLGYR